MNWIALAEFVLAVLVDADGRLPPPARHHAAQRRPVRLALASAVLLLGLWELGKLIVRRRRRPAEAMPPAAAR